MEVNRREFLAGMTALTAAALCGSNATFAPDSCDTCKLDGYLRKKDPSQLSVSFLGTFALFVFKDRIEAYTPKIVDGQGNRLHNYWFAKPTGGQGLNSDHLFDLQSPNKFGAISSKPGASGTVPTFNPCSPGQPNNIDNVVNLVVDAPTPGNYLHQIVLPLPDDIVLAGWSQKNTHPIFDNQKDFCYLARDHRFLYNAGRFDKNNLTFNGTPVEPGLDFRFLSEPHPQDENQVAKECQDPKFHIERAMTALAQMLQKRDNEFQVNTEYCNQQTVPAVAIASTRDARRDRRGVAMSAGPHGGDVVQIASRLPACQSVIINATGP